MSQRDLETCLLIIAKKMTEKEKKAEFYFDEAIEIYKKGDSKTAKIKIEKAIELNPKDAETYFNLAVLLSIVR